MATTAKKIETALQILTEVESGSTELYRLIRLVGPSDLILEVPAHEVFIKALKASHQKPPIFAPSR